jgi:23S rRNA (adenine1618-N6)-methyltransferase
MANKQHHSRNIHINGYNLAHLKTHSPVLAPYIFSNQYNQLTIDFSQQQAVKALNQALLMVDYKLAYWDIPESNLCPAVPGRADYIHLLADLLSEQDRDEDQNTNQDKDQIPTGKQITLLDIGTGASLIYPILANKIYGWKAVGTDINQQSLKQAQNLVQFNKLPIKLRHQKQPDSIFNNVIKPNDYFAITCCNPPFHRSLEEAKRENQRKWQNLKKEKQTGFNFSGLEVELWCEGGELAFIRKMIAESVEYKTQIGWFTTLVSKKDNLMSLCAMLEKTPSCKHKIIELKHGQKSMRVLCWRYQI